MTVRVVSTDPLTSSRVLFQPESDGSAFTLIDQQDAGPIIEHNKILKTMGPHDRTSEVRRVASIPLVVWQKLQDDWRAQALSWEEKQRAMTRFLADPDNAAFRCDQTKFYVR